MGKRERRVENHKSGNISEKPARTLMERMADTYRATLSRDVYGKRAATPYEVQRTIEGR